MEGHIHQPSVKFSEFSKPLIALIQDAIEVQKFLDANENQCTRRMLVRSLFAYFEGSVWLIKQSCLKATCEVCRKVRSPENEGLLLDESYEVGENGKVKVRPRFTPLASNLRFAFSTFSELSGVEIDVMSETHHWQNFKAAIEIRNRITHPRSEEDLHISDEEFAKCKDAENWFNVILHEVMAVMTGDRIEGA